MEVIVRNKVLIGSFAVAALAMSAGVYAQAGVDGVAVTRLLKERLPKTKVTSVDCVKVGGLCEVVAGKNLFYTDGGARYLFVGRLYDMETRQDLTAAKLLEINPDMLVGGNPASADAGDGGTRAEQLALPDSTARPALADAGVGQAAALTKVDVSTLSSAGAIVWGKQQGKTVTIFTDFRCGYCRALVATLEKMNVRVIERPISVLGGRELAEGVLCSRDKVAAARDAYAGVPTERRSCDTSGLDENEAFARRNGFAGTPIIVRSDGAKIEGFRPREELERWLSAVRR